MGDPVDTERVEMGKNPFPEDFHDTFRGVRARVRTSGTPIKAGTGGGTTTRMMG